MPAPSGATLIDRVDAANRPIGVVPRADVFDRHANFRTVHVLVTNADGLLLLQQLAPKRARHGGEWGSSVAGYLFAGESYEAAAIRRLREELAISAVLTDLGVLAVQDGSVTKFVGVFSTTAQHPRIAEPDHIAAIEFRAPDDVAADIADGLSTYTETFRQVFAYWRLHSRPE